MKVIVGLGNPGSRYDKTRHNIGFRIVDAVLNHHSPRASYRSLKIGSKESPVQIMACEFETNSGQLLMLIKPLTFMNLSGIGLKCLLEERSLTLDSVLVIHDEVYLPLGTLRFKKDGSAGGQKGVQSIIDQLARDDFDRLRIGVGPKPESANLSDFVLGSFDSEEEKVLQEFFPKALLAVQTWIDHGIETAMNQFN